MRPIELGRILRMLRVRRGWRQRGVAAKADLSPSAVGRHENGHFLSLRAIERHAAAFAMRVEVRLVGRGAELPRLLDDEHAAIVEWFVRILRQAGWLVEVEASYSEWGERGRIDLLAFDPRTGTLLIVEVKTRLVDLQDLFGGLNAKERLAATIARRRGWEVSRARTVLAVARTAANEAVVRDHPSLFGPFAIRPFTPDRAEDPDQRLLHWVTAREAGRSKWIAGRQGVHRPHRSGARTGGDHVSPTV